MDEVGDEKDDLLCVKRKGGLAVIINKGNLDSRELSTKGC
jgi:hypothetical protein